MAGIEQSAEPRGDWRRRAAPLVVWTMAALYVAAHAPFLAQSAHDIDGVNFTLALHEYDVAKDQPHAPGSPLFVGLGRLARTAIGWVSDDPSSASLARGRDVAALAFWSAAFGALAAFGVFRLFTALGQPATAAVLAAGVMLACPLFWFTGVRPMSDLPGLAVALLALGELAPWLSQHADRQPSRVSLIVGCLLAGIAPGLRVQMAWLIWPAAGAAVAAAARRRLDGPILAAAAWTLGLAAWLVPLMLLVGGPIEYARLMTLQGNEDVAAGQMLATSFTVRAAAEALRDSLLGPWGSPWLGATALMAASMGLLHVLRRRARVVVALAVMFGPYALFHFGFHETSHIRYALPLVPLIAMLSVEGFFVAGRRIGIGATMVLLAAALTIAVTPSVLQSREPAPVFRAFDDLRQRLADGSDQRPVLAMHHSVAVALRGETSGLRVLPSPVRYEWLEVARYWQTDGAAPVWFLASRLRSDLALIDPMSRRVVSAYRHPASARPLLAGSRPRGVEWVEMTAPGWVALEGWALTPEVRGVTIKDYQRDRKPIPRALIRRRAEDVMMLLGGRHFGGLCSTAATIRIEIDGREFTRFNARAGDSFVQTWRVPAETLRGEGRFAELQITAEDRTTAAPVDVAFEQFDVQGPGGAIPALAEGWFEPEFDARDGVTFRWMSDRAAIDIEAFSRDVVLDLRGGSPRRDFSQPSQLTIRAGTVVLESRAVADDFTISVRVPATVLQASKGRLDLEVSQAFVPDEQSGNGDRRSLALRVFAVDVRVQDQADRRVAMQLAAPGSPVSESAPR